MHQHKSVAARATRVILAVVVCGLATTCNDYPVHSLLDSFEVRVTDQLTNEKPVKLDFLWVIDHSPSMCQEQRQLAKGFKNLTDVLNSFGEGAIDAQMAVVTVQQAPDKTDIKVVGRFKHSPATAFPPNCYERIRTNCLNNAQCGAPAAYTFATPTDTSMCLAKPPQRPEVQKKTEKWKCKGPKAEDGSIKASKTSNLNCSLNTYCEATCNKGADGDKFCGDLFESELPAKDRTIQCSVPGGGAGLGGCIFQPETKACAEFKDLPPVIGHDELDKFACLATVGAAQTQESKFEGGFRSAWTALDPDGPNCDYDACVKDLRTCCVGNPEWCKETDPAVIAQNKAKCEVDKVEQCEYLTPYGHCKRQIKDCCQGPYDTECTTHRDAKKCEAAVKSQCDKLKGKKDRVAEACQNTKLLRPDGYLVMVFVSDDDDCSMHLELHPHDKNVMTKEIWEKCQVHGDSVLGNRALAEGHCEFKRDKSEATGTAMYCPSDCLVGSTTKTPKGLLKCPNGCKKDSKERADCLEKAMAQMDEFDQETTKNHSYKSPMEHLAGWQFAPVSDFVNRFKSLKDDPAKVIVAAITGDTSYGESPYDDAALQQQHRDRVNFYHAMKKDVGPGQAPYVCLGERGEASYGSRYVALADAFRDNGVNFNICKGSSFGPALRGIAEQILKRVVKICLPQPPEVDQAGDLLIKVMHTRDGKSVELKRVDGTGDPLALQYSIQSSTDCRAGKTGLEGEGASCRTTRECTAGLTCVTDCVKTAEDDCSAAIGQCLVYDKAIFFTQTLDKADKIEVNYKADLGL